MQQVVFPWRQLHLDSAHRDVLTIEIDPDFIALGHDGLGLRLRATALQNSDTGQQFLDPEWLGDTGVWAQVKPSTTVPLLSARLDSTMIGIVDPDKRMCRMTSSPFMSGNQRLCSSSRSVSLRRTASSATVPLSVCDIRE
jgi:hypothetical protein